MHYYVHTERSYLYFCIETFFVPKGGIMDFDGLSES